MTDVPYIHIYIYHNYIARIAVPFMWGSLRLAPINLLVQFIISMQQGITVFLRTQLKATCLEGTVVHTTLQYITDSGPALEHPSSALSSNTAFERALPSFSLCLTMVTNDSRVTEASSHLSSAAASFPEASNLKLYGHKIFMIVINNLDTSVIVL